MGLTLLALVMKLSTFLLSNMSSKVGLIFAMILMFLSFMKYSLKIMVSLLSRMGTRTFLSTRVFCVLISMHSMQLRRTSKDLLMFPASFKFSPFVLARFARSTPARSTKEIEEKFSFCVSSMRKIMWLRLEFWFKFVLCVLRFFKPVFKVLRKSFSVLMA